MYVEVRYNNYIVYLRTTWRSSDPTPCWVMVLSVQVPSTEYCVTLSSVTDIGSLLRLGQLLGGTMAGSMFPPRQQETGAAVKDYVCWKRSSKYGTYYRRATDLSPRLPHMHASC